MSKMILVRVGAVIGAVALVAACSSSKSGPAKTTPPGFSIGGATSTTALPSDSSAAASLSSSASAGSLSGTWSGHYSGTFQGTFELTWTQTGSTLAGTITLSTAPTPVPLNGTVNGDSISFGTVGSAAITYTGKVSGNSMSGTYQVGGSAGGPWSASRM